MKLGRRMRMGLPDNWQQKSCQNSTGTFWTKTLRRTKVTTSMFFFLLLLFFPPESHSPRPIERCAERLRLTRQMPKTCLQKPLWWVWTFMKEQNSATRPVCLFCREWYKKNAALLWPAVKVAFARAFYARTRRRKRLSWPTCSCRRCQFTIARAMPWKC